MNCVQRLLLWNLEAPFLDISFSKAKVTLDPLEVCGLLEEGTKERQCWLLLR